MRNPMRAEKLSALAALNIVRRDMMSELVLKASVGSWVGERAAQRPSAWKMGSAS